MKNVYYAITLPVLYLTSYCLYSNETDQILICVCDELHYEFRFKRKKIHFKHIIQIISISTLFVSTLCTSNFQYNIKYDSGDFMHLIQTKFQKVIIFNQYSSTII